jgi:hypothetical protein
MGEIIVADIATRRKIPVEQELGPVGRVEPHFEFAADVGR